MHRTPRDQKSVVKFPRFHQKSISFYIVDSPGTYRIGLTREAAHGCVTFRFIIKRRFQLPLTIAISGRSLQSRYKCSRPRNLPSNFSTNSAQPFNGSDLAKQQPPLNWYECCESAMIGTWS